MKTHSVEDAQYAHAMGHLLVLYTQVDQFIMEACAERIASAPGQDAKMGLAKQVGDECRHVAIQQRWMQEFGVVAAPVIGQQVLEQLHGHFRALDWFEQVGANSQQLCAVLDRRRDELITELAA